jgi:hypothetical protein
MLYSVGMVDEVSAEMPMVSKKPNRGADSRRGRHGMAALKAKIALRGLNSLDKRSPGAKALLRWRGELERDLGGPESLSAQQRTLVEMAARVRLYLDHLDGFLMEQSSLVNKRRKSALPILRERQTLADSLQRILTQLGIARVEPPMPSLNDYLRQREQIKPPDEEPEPDEIIQASDAQDDSVGADLDAESASEVEP